MLHRLKESLDVDVTKADAEKKGRTCSAGNDPGVRVFPIPRLHLSPPRAALPSGSARSAPGRRRTGRQPHPHHARAGPNHRAESRGGFSGTA